MNHLVTFISHSGFILRWARAISIAASKARSRALKRQSHMFKTASIFRLGIMASALALCFSANAAVVISQVYGGGEKWPRLFEQYPPTFKWTPGGLP
jgi:hypothetical protein